jgi:hypothetical protein
MDALLIGIVGLVIVAGIGGPLADAIVAARPVPEVTRSRVRAVRAVPGRTLTRFDALQQEIDRAREGRGDVPVIGMGVPLADAFAARTVPERTPTPVRRVHATPGRTLTGFDALQQGIDRVREKLDAGAPRPPRVVDGG